MFLTDKGASTLLLFFNLLILAFGEQFQFPVTPSTVEKQLGFDQLTTHLVRYAACPICHTLYHQDNIPGSCSSSAFAFHQRCGASLLNNSRPRKEFAYNSLVKSIQNLFSRPNFEKKINEWRKRTGIPADHMFDIYDGAMWTGIMDADDDRRSFVEHPRSLLLTLNVDWFRPFKNSHYSCGAIYLVVNNLPRNERFKKENVILVGVMPGPKEAKTYEMNHYLEPLVSELEKLYVGVRMSTHEHPNDEVTVRAALLMVACDIPAARKVSGFTSHNSTRACYKCVRNFTRSETANRLDYSGFDVTTWIPTTWQQNVEDAQRWLAAQNLAERRQLERETGVR